LGLGFVVNGLTPAPERTAKGLGKDPVFCFVLASAAPQPALDPHFAKNRLQNHSKNLSPAPAWQSDETKPPKATANN
jgi:hypothetical protein